MSSSLFIASDCLTYVPLFIYFVAYRDEKRLPVIHKCDHAIIEPLNELVITLIHAIFPRSSWVVSMLYQWYDYHEKFHKEKLE